MPADVLLRSGAVYTFDPAHPMASAIAINGSIIAAVGDNQLHALRGSHTRVIDLAGRAVVPGFVDAHVHFTSYALTRQQVDLESAATLDAGLAKLRAVAERLPRHAWIRGRGWDRNRWGRLPTMTDLDQAVGGRPAALSSHDGHSVWLSSAALRQVGLTRDTQAPAGGHIERDLNGDPTGVVFENAQDLVRPHLPQPTDAEVLQALRSALRHAAAAGITGLHNLEDARSLRAFQALEASGELSLRVYHGVPRAQLRQARELGARTGTGTDWLRIGPVKLFADGALGSRTAYLLDPYEQDSDGYRGIPTLQSEELRDDLRTAAEAGLDISVHAIGDAAVRGVLDAVEDTRRATPALRQRLVRIEHAQLVHPDDVPRFAALGVIASMQPSHAVSDWQAAERYWGARSRYGYAWRSLLDAGAQLAFGTDAPVESIEPLPSLYAAVTRLDRNGRPPGGWYPEQRLELGEAVRAYTRGSAYAERAAHRRGSLVTGRDADLVVLSPNPFAHEPAALLNTRVDLTMVGGRVLYERA
jgi:predicted amidohydrolase YtcJ